MVCHGYACGCTCPKCSKRQANLPKRISSRKDVRDEAAMLQRLGFTYAGQDSRGHTCWAHPDHGEVKLTNTPSDRNWRRSFRHGLAKQMGMNRFQLERLIAGQSPKPNKERPAKPGRQTPESILMRDALALGIGLSRTAARRLLAACGYDLRSARHTLHDMRDAALRAA